MNGMRFGDESMKWAIRCIDIPYTYMCCGACDCVISVLTLLVCFRCDIMVCGVIPGGGSASRLAERSPPCRMLSTFRSCRLRHADYIAHDARGLLVFVMDF